MVYAYFEDEFLVAGMNDIATVEQFEDDAIAEVEKLKITDAFFKERLVKCGVYKRLAGALLEAEGEVMDKKLKYYTKEWGRYYNLAKTNQPIADTSVSSVPFIRG